MKYFDGDSVMIHTGKYISFIATFKGYTKKGRAIVDVDLSPKPTIRRLFLLESNISPYRHS